MFKQYFEQVILLIVGAILGLIFSKVDINLCYYLGWILLLLFITPTTQVALFRLIQGIVRMDTRRRGEVAIFLPVEFGDKTSHMVDVSFEELKKAATAGIAKIKITPLFASAATRPILINPYGESYPEKDIEKHSSLEKVLDYVYGGGIYINLAGIPFYYAISKQAPGRKIQTTRELTGGDIEIWFKKTLVAQRLALPILGYSADPSSSFYRAALIEEGIESWGMELSDGVRTISSGLALPYGKGWFIFHTASLNAANYKGVIAVALKHAQILRDQKSEYVEWDSLSDLP